MDRRTTPATTRVALSRLRGRLDRPAWTEGTPARVAAPLTDLCREPAGARERQLLRGAEVLVIDEDRGWAFVEAAHDGYCGWLGAAALTGARPPLTHRVSAPATQVYPAPDLKQRELCSLSLGARLAVAGTEGGYARLADGGFVPLPHLADAPEGDPVAVARRLLGTPYLWGGNSRGGIDCSGLVQAALGACGLACPGDSDQQQAAVGRALPEGAPLQAGDLLFWAGHVAMATGPDAIIHATAHLMAVIEEPMVPARARIEAVAPWRGARRPPL